MPHHPAPALACTILLATAMAAEDAPTRMMEATFKLYNKDSTATGFFILPPEGPDGRALIVTAAHVFKRMTGDSAIVVLREPEADGTWKRHDHGFPIRASGKDLWTTHPTLDVAAIRLRLPEGAHVHPLPLSALASEEALIAAKVHYGSGLMVLGYPTRAEANASGFPILRHASVASYPLVPVGPHQTFVADFTTFAGDSGGPVILPAPPASGTTEPLVVGLVLSQIRHDETRKTMYEESSIHIPLMLSNIIHATYIRETIALLPKE